MRRSYGRVERDLYMGMSGSRMYLNYSRMIKSLTWCKNISDIVDAVIKEANGKPLLLGFDSRIKKGTRSKVRKRLKRLENIKIL